MHFPQEISQNQDIPIKVKQNIVQLCQHTMRMQNLNKRILSHYCNKKLIPVACHVKNIQPVTTISEVPEIQS